MGNQKSNSLKNKTTLILHNGKLIVFDEDFKMTYFEIPESKEWQCTIEVMIHLGRSTTSMETLATLHNFDTVELHEQALNFVEEYKHTPEYKSKKQSPHEDR